MKDNVALFSSDDPNTPMKRAFLAHTLMRKDHDEHRDRAHGDDAGRDAEDDRERLGAPSTRNSTKEYLYRLPRNEVVDLFPTLAGPLAARILADAMGVPDASDALIRSDGRKT